jgi:hypothetical protein
MESQRTYPMREKSDIFQAQRKYTWMRQDHKGTVHICRRRVEREACIACRSSIEHGLTCLTLPDLEHPEVVEIQVWIRIYRPCDNNSTMLQLDARIPRTHVI